MNSFELNKIIGAILGTLLFVMGAGFVAEAIYAPIEDRGPGYALPEPEGTAMTAEAPAEEAATPLPVLLADADPTAGANVAKKCQSCHSFEEGGPNKTGPNLWGVVGRPIASHPGFNYDEALHQLAEEEGNWTFENLNAFLTSPKAVAPGTKMTFPGVKKDTDRADLLAYLQTLSNDPVPFPAVEAPADVPAAPAEGNVVEGTTTQPDVAAPSSSEANPSTEPGVTTGEPTQETDLGPGPGNSQAAPGSTGTPLKAQPQEGGANGQDQSSGQSAPADGSNSSDTAPASN